MALLSLPPCPLLPLTPLNFSLYGIADKISQFLADPQTEPRDLA